MEGPNLLMVCILSCAVVLVVLSLLAVIMRMLTWAFPGVVKKKDASTLAAITTAVSARYSGYRITEIKENK